MTSSSVVPNVQYKQAVGGFAHQAIAALASRDPRPRVVEQEELWAIARRTVPDRALGSRTRVARLMVASAAAVYGHYFMPSAEWQFVAAEMRVGETERIDLAWKLKLAAAFGRPTGDGRTRQQITRYARVAVQEHGRAFAGVRLILLGAPRHSQFLDPDERSVSLADTHYWFELVGAAR